MSVTVLPLETGVFGLSTSIASPELDELVEELDELDELEDDSAVWTFFAGVGFDGILFKETDGFFAGVDVTFLVSPESSEELEPLELSELPLSELSEESASFAFLLAALGFDVSFAFGLTSAAELSDELLEDELLDDELDDDDGEVSSVDVPANFFTSGTMLLSSSAGDWRMQKRNDEQVRPLNICMDAFLARSDVPC